MKDKEVINKVFPKIFQKYDRNKYKPPIYLFFLQSQSVQKCKADLIIFKRSKLSFSIASNTLIFNDITLTYQNIYPFAIYEQHS